MQRLSGRLQESNHRGPLPRRGPSTFTLWKIIYCIQFLIYALCSSMLLLKFFVHSKCQVVAYNRLKTIENHSTFRPKKWSRSLTGDGRLQELEVATVRLWLGKFRCFGLGVAYGRWSLTWGGGSSVACLTDTLNLPCKWSRDVWAGCTTQATGLFN